MAPCVGVPDGFTCEMALRFSSSFSSGVLHLSFVFIYFGLPHLGFDFCGAKVVKGAADKIPPFYFACFLPAGFPFSLITRRKPGIPEECTKLFGHSLFIFHS